VRERKQMKRLIKKRDRNVRVLDALKGGLNDSLNSLALRIFEAALKRDRG